ncbi:MAG: CRTAC1 family protein, partial [Chloroflexi bacterium]|nr:CRTAC1 family protein [Chloroflexota bacterium]
YSDVVTWKQPNQMFHNRGNGTFEDVSIQTVGPSRNVSRGVAFGDLFNNGRTDILVNTLRDHPILLRNEWVPENHWLTLQLHASWGNPQAVGATVYLTSGKTTQRRDVRAGGSYASFSDLRPHFGLGASPGPVTVAIRWPSGRKTVLNHPQIDSIVQVFEPKP